MDIIIDKFQIREKLIKNIGHYRYEHSIRVMEEAEKLAKRYGYNENKASIAGLLHDCGRLLDKFEILKKAYDFDIIQKDNRVNNFPLIHAPLGAEIARREFNILDEDILNAIRYHTTGRPNMSLIDKIVYIADYIEPERNFNGLDEVRKLAYDDLDKAILKAMDNTIKYLINKGAYIHPDTINSRNFIINEIK